MDLKHSCKFWSLIKTHHLLVCNIINMMPYNGCSQMLHFSHKTEKSFIAHPGRLLCVVGLEEYSAHDWRAATSGTARSSYLARVGPVVWTCIYTNTEWVCPRVPPLVRSVFRAGRVFTLAQVHAQFQVAEAPFRGTGSLICKCRPISAPYSCGSCRKITPWAIFAGACSRIAAEAQRTHGGVNCTTQFLQTIHCGARRRDPCGRSARFPSWCKCPLTIPFTSDTTVNPWTTG